MGKEIPYPFLFIGISKNLTVVFRCSLPPDIFARSQLTYF